ncbi:MAG: hypothetical protein J4G05_09040 [Chlorobi bacterium]|nr:hypothetical protein [Chlorobiota bacterium]
MNRSLLKATARVVLVAFLFEALAPAVSLWALTGGPTQPEFSSFEPVTTTNMVNPLTGQFTYNLPVINIPGPNGGGYAMSLSYHSGASPEQEASWVGYGWTLNPGSITRVKRGLPDEYNGERVRYWNKTEPSLTVSVGVGVAGEIFSQTPLSSADVRLRYNSHKGYGFVAGVAADVKGLGSLNFSVSDEGPDATFSTGISVGDVLNFVRNKTKKPEESAKFQASDVAKHRWASKGLSLYQNLLNTGYSYLQHSVASGRPTARSHPYRGVSTNLELSLHGPLPLIPAGAKLQTTGHYARQDNKAFIEPKAYGYMYSGNAGDDDVMDYYVEKDNGFDKRDEFLGIPFSNADYFNVSGEGLGGGFRLYNKKPGHFHPNKTRSETKIVNAEANIHFGQDIGVGGSAGGGKARFDIEPWTDRASTWKFAAPGEGDEPFFFRMNNDLGGHVSYAPDDDAFRASQSIYNKPQISSSEAGYLNSFGQTGARIAGSRSGRSSYIAYSTVGEMQSIKRRGIYLTDLMLLEDSDFSAYRYLNHLPSTAIGEISVTNPSGAKYTYGLPVIALEEKQLQFGLNKLSHSAPSSEGRVTSYVPKLQNTPVVVGEELLAPYVSEYLLTSVASADYVDRTHNGYSNDDFGGWVRFNYKSITHREDWNTGYYKWRIPYKGLQYQPNRLSDKKDDMGSVISGKKGLFFLSSVETKSHVALFYTNSWNRHPKKSIVAARGAWYNRDWQLFEGSSEIRKDGYPAWDNESEASNGNRSRSGTVVDPTKNSQGNQAYNKMRRLEKIELWSKDENGDLQEQVQTVHFEYDYSLSEGMPNAYNGAGKLTLKRVYFEYNGVVNARISPYVFGYEYRKEADYAGLPADLKTKYQDIVNYGEDLDATEQNPDYSPNHVGRWGYYQHDGENRARNMIPWEHQNPPEESFDPAAWNLKWIRLPSGGEIHVQYEQNEYGYLQDQPAMVMAHLAAYQDYENSDDSDPKRFYLDLQKTFGIDNTASEDAQKREDLIAAMRELFVEKDEKMYFKVLHSLDGDAANPENKDIVDLPLKQERVEYMTGYASVKSVDSDGQGVYLELADGDYATPDEAVKDFVKKTRGRLNGQRPLDVSGDTEGNVKALFSMFNFIQNFVGEDIGDDDDEIDINRSWVRIPVSSSNKVARAKKGGGIRVKNLLMHDPGLDQAEEGHLFGTTYLYETQDGYTSGVAANEPAEGREENALVKLLDKRQDQGWLGKLIVGKEKETFEGPIGESLLPGPAVVYSRVVAKNIHSGKTNPGFTIQEYYTAKDYPSQVLYDKDEIDNKRVTDADIKSPVPLYLWSPWGVVSASERTAYQGYSFVLNGLHGQMKKVATYGGDYDNPEDWVESSMQEYEYFAPGEKVPVFKEYTTDPVFDYVDLGKEMEVVFEGKEMTDLTVDAIGHVDATIGLIFFPPIFVSGSGQLNYSRHVIRTHVTCKVVRYPVIVKKVTARQDGIESSTTNRAFNPLTGAPVLTETTDGYTGLALQKANGTGIAPHDRLYRSFAYPAALEYGEMGQKASNEGKVIESNSAMTISKYYSAGKHYLSLKFNVPGALCDAGTLFTPGDLIRLTTNLTNGTNQRTLTWKLGDYHVESAAGNRVVIQPYSLSWPSLVFLGSTFNPNTVPSGWTSDDLKVKIVKSGKTNQLNAPRAGITTYGAGQ